MKKKKKILSAAISLKKEKQPTNVDNEILTSNKIQYTKEKEKKNT